MKSNRCSSAGSSGTRGSRSFPNNERIHTTRPEDSDFNTHILRMDQTMRAHTESARLQFYKHQAAWWKSQFVAAQYENRMLKQLLDQLYQVPNVDHPRIVSLTTPHSSGGRTHKVKKNETRKREAKKCQPKSEDESGSEGFELSEEFMQFLDINRKHREERERERTKLKKERGSESEMERVERMEQEPSDDTERIRREQLRMLYGDSCKQVEGLETYVQMKYDQFCDRNKPAYWPNIPLNL